MSRLPGAVVFDLDGTIVDTLGDIAASMNAALALRGLGPFDAATYAPWIGEGVAHLAERALGPSATADAVAALVADYRAHYAEHMLDRTAPFPGVPELLDRLGALGVPLGVLSNKSDPPTQAIVAHVFPGRFAAVLGQRPTHAAKPDPEGARIVCAALGVLPRDAVLVGDTEIDVATARAAGMRAIAVTWGMRTREALAATEPDALVDRPLELLSHLGG